MHWVCCKKVYTKFFYKWIAIVGFILILIAGFSNLSAKQNLRMKGASMPGILTIIFFVGEFPVQLLALPVNLIIFDYAFFYLRLHNICTSVQLCLPFWL